MKKLLLFALLSIVLVGCSKDEDGFSIIGKTYICYLGDSFDKTDYSYNIRFIDDTKYEFSYKQSSRIIETQIYTYTLDYPDIIFHEYGTKSYKQENEKGVFIDDKTIRIKYAEYSLK